jgi:16S rRNA (guanine966-N2)-methyltransferase
MRIIAGRWRGRKLATPKDRAIRPTADRAREALFNILEHGEPRLLGARFLDLFAGTGAIGLEALSRGAAEVVLVESDRAAARLIEANLRALGEPADARLVRADAARLGPAPHPFDLVVLDPPWRSGLARPALESLLAGGWLAPQARIVAELAAGETVEPPRGLVVEQERRYGAAAFVFLRCA